MLQHSLQHSLQLAWGMPYRGMTSHEQIDQVLANPAVHNYLKDAIRVFMNKDCVDACQDSKLLADLMLNRMNSLLGTSYNHSSTVKL